MREAPSILIVCLHAFPDTAVGARRVSELGNFLSLRGWSVTVAASEWSYELRSGELGPGVRRLSVRIPRTVFSYIRSWIPRSWRGSAGAVDGGAPVGAAEDHGPPSLSSRWTRRARELYLQVSGLVDPWKRFSLRLLVALLRDAARRRPDVILVSGPAWSPVLAASITARLIRRPLVVDYRDPWISRTEVAADTQKGWQRRVGLLLERWTLRTAAAVTSTTSRAAMLLEERYPFLLGRTAAIANGFDAEQVIAVPPPTGALRLFFAGTIYYNRNPFPLLEGLAALLRRPEVDPSKVRCLMVGDCRAAGGLDLAAWIRENGLEQVVELGGAVPAAEVRRLTAESNVLVNFAQKQDDRVPAKIFEQLAARRHILLFTEPDSEVAELACASPAVMRLDDDAGEVARVLTKLYRLYVVEPGPTQLGDADLSRFSRDGSLQQFAELLTPLAASRADRD